MDPFRKWPLLVGSDRRRTKLWLLATIGLFFASSFYWALARERGGTDVQLALGVEGHLVLLVGLVAIQAYTNDGLLLSWALAFAAVVAAILETIPAGAGATAPPDSGTAVGLVLVGGLGVAALVGTIGFVIGEIAKGAVRRLRA